MQNCESLSIPLAARPEQCPCREQKSKPGIHTAQGSVSLLGNELDFEFLQKSGPYFTKSSPRFCNQNPD